MKVSQNYFFKLSDHQRIIKTSAFYFCPGAADSYYFNMQSLSEILWVYEKQQRENDGSGKY